MSSLSVNASGKTRQRGRRTSGTGVRGVERRRHASISTPDSFVDEYGSLSEQPTNESYLRSSPCHGMSYLRLTSAHIPIFVMFKHPSPSHPPRCLALCQREWETITLRMTPPSSIPQDVLRLRWSTPRVRLQDRQPSTTQECRAFCPGLRTRRRIHPSNRRASRIRLPPRQIIAATTKIAFVPLALRIVHQSSRVSDLRRSKSREMPASSYRSEMDDGNIDEMWSPPSLLSSSSSPPFRQSPQSCSPSEFRTRWEDEDMQDVALHHSNSTYSPEFLSFSPFTGWNAGPDGSAASLDSPASSSFSHIPLHQPQPVRPIVLIRAPLLNSIDEQMCDDTEGDGKFSLRSSKAQRRRRDRNPNLITSIA